MTAALIHKARLKKLSFTRVFIEGLLGFKVATYVLLHFHHNKVEKEFNLKNLLTENIFKNKTMSSLQDCQGIKWTIGLAMNRRAAETIKEFDLRHLIQKNEANNLRPTPRPPTPSNPVFDASRYLPPTKP